MSDFSSICPVCNAGLVYANKIHHTPQYCQLLVFKEQVAPKHDMVSIAGALTAKFDFNYISRELKLIYPKVVSACFMTLSHHRVMVTEIFVERWSTDAILQYIKSDGYAGLSLSEFLDRVVTEKNVKSKPAED